VNVADRSLWKKVRYVLVLLALCAMATCPAARRAWLRRERAREAPGLLDALADRVEARWKERSRLPLEPAGPTPPLGACCDQGGTCAVDDAQWQAGGWAALGFTIDDPHRYSYQYVPAPDGKSAIVRAVGDLDCDGVRGTYEIKLEPNGDHLMRTASEDGPLE
jgi:hypothetical protein